MKTPKSMLVAAAALFALTATAVAAQPTGGKGQGAGAQGGGPAAATPGSGMGKGMGPGTARAGADYTPGWSLMTEQERVEPRARMREMKTYEECHTYQLQHHDLMAARARERGSAPLPQPRRDACAGFSH